MSFDKCRFVAARRRKFGYKTIRRSGGGDVRSQAKPSAESTATQSLFALIFHLVRIVPTLPTPTPAGVGLLLRFSAHCPFKENISSDCSDGMLLPPPGGGIAIRRVCWLLSSFVGECVR